MKLSLTEVKRHQITSWVRKIRKSDSKIIVSNYSYHCYFSGLPVTKTLIIFPDEIRTKGVITIDKPLLEVELPDIIKLYKRIKS